MSDVADNPPVALKKREIGIITNADHILAWNYCDNLNIICFADRADQGANEWHLALMSNGLPQMFGTVFGGKWRADRLVRGLRNTLTGDLKKRRRNKESRKARRVPAGEAPLAGPRPDMLIIDDPQPREGGAE